MTSRNLEELVTTVATRLMPVDVTTFVGAAEAVLAELVSYFGVDVAYLRHHDTSARTTTLVAEWPRRPHVPDPDPLGVISFVDADPIFAATEHLENIAVLRPMGENARYQERVAAASGVDETSTATVPLRSGSVTTGLLGLIKFGDRSWSDGETNALQAIGALLAQLQARLAAEAQLRHVAHHDELTGLANRRALLKHLEARNALGQPGPVAVLFLDVDRLKAMNDFLGHHAGDQFIVTVAQRLSEDACPGEFVARLGGDEFVVVMSGPADEERATRCAACIAATMGEPMMLGEQQLSRSVSIGITVEEPGVRTVSEWLRNADEAAMIAKASGGNCTVVYTAEMAERNAERNDIELHLRAAIRNGSLVLYYQPKVELLDGAIVGVEALVRWHHPTRGLLPPDAFIHVAEATNLAGELGMWVLDEACAQHARWCQAHEGLELQLCVNVSPVQLIATDFVAAVAGVLENRGTDPTVLTLEVTEHAVVGDLPQVRRTLAGLRRLGVDVAIDDFGTGYSSLAQLKTLQVRSLKIDRMFVAELGRNPDDLAIVRSIVALAQAFGLTIVAEGVEDERAAQVLMDLGCTLAQGFLFSAPVPADRMTEMLAVGRLPRGGKQPA